ncbi:formimidoylglutamate deiminase [Kribbella sp. VKM Ac-2566]|uniref:formimidoylglutamate deiminase n=1 Tax=Kribbella sp. VKM Ac-2566 TaxID=2512218 RepID=UPI0010639FED|nr:formimidoylglutamate deiminase [Kribbella sp. VKM Ac-2566]TDW81146.1 formiminoglutamate deiminase [Kribbella sp. VKM Ac-2566]
MTSYWCETALLPDGLTGRVLVSVVDGRFASVESGVDPGDAQVLNGLVVPGLANCHSHAFHRALRGRTQTERGTFWTWREQMYAVAAALTPDTYYELAKAVYAEMLLAGITAVGEFHYLHHAPGGSRYDDANAMGTALIAAARDAGLRIALLDTCYLAGGFDQPLNEVQQRFSDGDATAWASRVAQLAGAHGVAGADDVVIGAAAHSVRGVPQDQLGAVASAFPDVPLHIHLSEQVAENEACLAAYGRTPTQALDEAGFLSGRTSAVHATHLTSVDIGLLGSSATYSCFCPTTERDLADGIGPSVQLRDAGSPLTLGSDSHAVIDLFEEMRAVELDERLASQERGHWSAAELLKAATVDGHRSIGFEDAGVIAPGARADLVAIRLDSARTAGTGGTVETAVFAATAADVTDVVVSGRRVVAAGKHSAIDVPSALSTSIAAVTS